MHKLRRLVFFDRHTVQLHKPMSVSAIVAAPGDAPPKSITDASNYTGGSNIPKIVGTLNETDFFLQNNSLKITCVCGNGSTLFFGDNNGRIHWFHEDYVVRSMDAFGFVAMFMVFLAGRGYLVCVGKDSETNSGAKYHCYHVSSSIPPVEKLVLLREARLFSSNIPEQPITCFDANSTFSMLALGTRNSGACLFRGDLIKEKSCRLKIIRQNNSSVMGVHFVSRNDRQFMFLCTSISISSYYVPPQGDLQLLFMDESGTNSLFSSAVTISSQLLVLRNSAVYTYDCESGNLSAFPCDGHSVGLATHKRYFVAATSDVPSFSSLESEKSETSSRHTLYICLSYPEVRFLAFSGYFNGILYILSAMNAIYIFSTSDDNKSIELYKLREKFITERLDILLRKRLFEWATSVALYERQPDDVIQEIYRLHGDWLYEKRLYDQALTVYTRTIGFCEPSCIIEKFLDARRIQNLADYLLKLHESGLAVKEHTMMLFKCYTALQEIPKLESFLNLEYAQNYDFTVAITEFRESGYAKLALELALKRNLYELYVTILIEDFNDCSTAIQYMRSLSAPIACTIMMKCGRLLLKEQPENTLLLIQSIMKDYKPGVEVFIPLFVDCKELLESFLSSIVNERFDENNSVSPATSINRSAGHAAIFTYLELLLASYNKEFKGAKISARNGTMSGSRSSQILKGGNDTIATLTQSIMNLVKAYCSVEEQYRTVLNLCELYDFEVGILYCSEKIGNYQLPLSFHIRNQDVENVLNYCLKFGVKAPVLWTQGLAFFATFPDSESSIVKILEEIARNNSLPPLAVLSILENQPTVKLCAVKEYLLAVFSQLSTNLAVSNVRLTSDLQEISRMRSDVGKLENSLKYFEKTKCSQCELMLDLPAVHCYCGHSYHIHCIASDHVCHKCQNNIFSKKLIIEQRKFQGENSDEFYKFLRGSTDGLNYIFTCFGKGMFSNTGNFSSQQK